MSLSSNELNYLVWRYLQESGFDLAAFALEKHAHCSEYEREDNETIISKIQPGCLVNLVQKGILYSVAEDEAIDPSSSSFKNSLNLFGALLREEIENGKSKDEGDLNGDEETSRFLLKSEAKLNGNKPDENSMEIDSGDIESTNSNTNSVIVNEEFSTKVLSSKIIFDESLVSSWHPSTEVFAYGKQNSTAIINAIKDGSIAESVNLLHPNVLNSNNEINIVSWSPQGNVIITGGTDGELRAWSPDGKLRNIAHLFNDEIPEERNNNSPTITDLIWSQTGHLLLCIDTHGQVSLWDGNTLTLLKQINPPHNSENSESVIAACWLSNDKFAISTSKFSIKIYSVYIEQQSADVQTVGFLHGHENVISILKLNEISKLLASASDYDYQIKVWSRGASQEGIDLNISGDGIKSHNSPLISLEWLENINDESILLSVSIDGTLNIWNAITRDNLVSTELFKNHDNFKLNEESHIQINEDSLVFACALSPNLKYLAIGDDYGKVTIWDVSQDSIKQSKKQKFLKCLGIFDIQLPNIEQDSTTEHNTGICDIKWDTNSHNISVSYVGITSVILEWLY
ncbi:WD40-repeat-containing domain protein [Scheffersomyces amazonensis]|uniref:WD40-repeat-containing domain protein n=1 Tax=Scheffersomyces amazonensis TaxID=1078765 RepID=UPI00315C716D